MTGNGVLFASSPLSGFDIYFKSTEKECSSIVSKTTFFFISLEFKVIKPLRFQVQMEGFIHLDFLRKIIRLWFFSAFFVL